MPPKKSAWTLEEITAAIGEIAHDADSKDRLKALGMLSRLKGEAAGIPAPLTDNERKDRLTRLLLACGQALATEAFHSAFGAQKKPRRQFVMGMEDPAIEAQIENVTNLRLLYRIAPEARGKGIPDGYPARGGLEVKADWCRARAREILIERKRREIAEERIAERLPAPVCGVHETPGEGETEVQEAQEVQGPEPEEEVPVLRPDGD